MVTRIDPERRIENEIQAHASFRIVLVSLLAAVIGLMAGLVAYLLYNLIALLGNLFFFQRVSLTLPHMQDNQLGLLVIVIPALGGLIVGLMAKYGSSKIRGHGIPEAMEAVLTNRSRIEPRVAFLKPISAAIAIGTGGPFGAEGPIIQTGGALGSIVGQIIHTTAAERKVLLASGAAAGMAAVFSTPIAAVILAIELLLFEFKSRSFIPLAIASTMATSVHFLLMGRGPMFKVGAIDFGVPNGLLYYALLGVVCGLAAVAFSHALYWVEDQFKRLPLDEMWWPLVGGLALGVIGFFVPRVFGVGYDTITAILNDRLALSVLLLVMIFKSVALLISLGSGTSGGLLAPMFMASAAMGSVFARVANAAIPGAHLSPSAFALVAMGAVFGAASRATFALIIFAFEITRDYNAILPLMLTGVIADEIALVMLRDTIMTEKLARRGLRVYQDYETDVFQQVKVGDVMNQEPVTLPSTMKLSELADSIMHGDARYIRRQGFPIVDPENRLVGIITWGDVIRSLEQNGENGTTVLEAGTGDLILTYPDEMLGDALYKLLQYDIGRLPVVDRQDNTHLLGYLGRAEVIAGRRYRLHEESVREPGWLKRPDRLAARAHKN